VEFLPGATWLCIRPRLLLLEAVGLITEDGPVTGTETADELRWPHSAAFAVGFEILEERRIGAGVEARGTTCFGAAFAFGAGLGFDMGFGGAGGDAGMILVFFCGGGATAAAVVLVLRFLDGASSPFVFVDEEEMAARSSVGRTGAALSGASTTMVFGEMGCEGEGGKEW